MGVARCYIAVFWVVLTRFGNFAESCKGLVWFMGKGALGHLFVRIVRFVRFRLKI